jgi:response regulator NasT
MPVGLTVVLIDESAARRGIMEGLFADGGYKVAATLSRPNALKAACERYRPDVIAISTGRPSRKLLNVIESARESFARPIVMFSEDDTAKSMQAAIAAGVNAYIVVGLSGNRVRSAIDLAFANFNESQRLRSRAAEAEEALRNRKIIERAKGTLMKQRKIDEAEAYALLRRRAMANGARLVDVAKMINEAAEMLVQTPP